MGSDMGDSDLDIAFGEGMSEAYHQMQDVAREVIDMIKAGDTEEAVLRLERDFFPKWDSVSDSKRDLFAHQEAALSGAVGAR